MRTPDTVLRALLAIALCMPASAQWSRPVFSGKGEFNDIPSPHPLSYFAANPFLRDDGNDLCLLCTPEDKAKSAQRYSIRTVVKPVGALTGFHILDVLYFVSERDNPDGNEVKWKSILVQVGSDSYREIFHLQAFYTTVSIEPSRIIQSGSERVLATFDSDGGNGGGCWEGYWWFDRSGPHSLDFSKLRSAINDRVPEKALFRISCSDLDLKSQQIHSGVQKAEARCGGCDYVGEVTARFRLDGFIAVPVAISFKPADPQPQQNPD